MKQGHFIRSGLNERIAAFICGVLLLVVLLITATQTLCYWIPGWWRTEYEKYNTPQYVTGEMSMDDAVYITEQMLEYCIGRIDTLDDTQATIDGVTAPFFTDREKQHLSDCRDIFLGCVRFRAVSLLMIAGLLIAVWFSIKSRCDASRIKVAYARTLAGGYLSALIVLLLLAMILVMIGMVDFTYLFTKFHHVFFDNDLWILNPKADNLVNVMQESVFADAAVTIGCIWGGISAILAAASILVIRRAR